MPNHDLSSKQKQADAPPGAEVNMLDVLLLLQRNGRMLIAAPLLAGLCGLGVSFAMKPTFTASAQILVPQGGQSASLMALGAMASGMAGAVGGGLLPGIKNPADQWVGLLNSRRVADALVDRFGLMKIYQSEHRFQARDALAGNTRIQARKDGMIAIEVDDIEPRRSAELANGYVSELQHLSNVLAVTEAGQRRLFLEKQLAQSKKALQTAQAVLNASGLSKDLLKASPDAAIEAMVRLRAQVAAQEVRVAVLQVSMTPDNPLLQSALTELRALRQQLAQVERAEPDRTAAAAGGGYSDAFREYRYQESLYELLAKQFELAKAEEAREGTIIQVVDAAQVPEWKSGPKRAFIAVSAAAGGFFLALMYVIVQAALRHYREDPVNAAKLRRLVG